MKQSAGTEEKLTPLPSSPPSPPFPLPFPFLRLGGRGRFSSCLHCGFPTPDPLHPLSARLLWACGFVDRIKPNSSEGAPLYYFPEGTYNSGHLLSKVRVFCDRRLTCVPGNIGKACISQLVPCQASQSAMPWGLLWLYF